MKVIQQYMVRDYNKWHLLIHCEDDQYFITDTGAFGQRDMTWRSISKEEAQKLLNPKQMSA